MNTVILIGRVTKDPELRYTATKQTAVCSFTLAVPRIGAEGVDFPRITVMGKQAENFDKYIKQGRQVAVTGRIQTGSYEKDGKKVYTTEVYASNIEYLGTQDKKETPDETQVETQVDFTAINEDVPF